MTENQVQDFWQNHPCGEMLVGGLSNYEDYQQFFEKYDDYRYTKLDHLPKLLNKLNLDGRKVLEIGLGQGADSEQMIKRGASWSGVDLTEESLKRVEVRFKLKNLTYDDLKQGSVLDLPFDDDRFDMVFSHGVLHHVPEIKQAQKEILRVLKPSGKLIIMVYAKYSLNYLFSIKILRRLGLIGLYITRINPGGLYNMHLTNAQKFGLFKYLKIQNFIHANTDGPLNPYSKVYSVSEVQEDFSKFEIQRSHKKYMHAPPLRIKWLPLENFLGWHLWVEMIPRKIPKVNA